MVLDGKLNRKTGVRIIRDGIVVYTGRLSSLKRFKEDVQEVQKGYNMVFLLKTIMISR